MKFLLALNAFYVFYVIFLGLILLRKRVQAVRTQQIDGRYFKTYQGEVPRDLKVWENHFNNQFQVPLLFMMTSLFAIQSQALNVYVLTLSMVFVLTRLLHSFIHLGNNIVIYRAGSYFAGFICVALIWIFILLELI